VNEKKKQQFLLRSATRLNKRGRRHARAADARPSGALSSSRFGRFVFIKTERQTRRLPTAQDGRDRSQGDEGARLRRGSACRPATLSAPLIVQSSRSASSGHREQHSSRRPMMPQSSSTMRRVHSEGSAEEGAARDEGGIDMSGRDRAEDAGIDYRAGVTAAARQRVAIDGQAISAWPKVEAEGMPCRRPAPRHCRSRAAASR